MNRIDLKKIVDNTVGVEKKRAMESRYCLRSWQRVARRSVKTRIGIDDVQQQSYEQKLTNLRVLEWLNDMTSDNKETTVTNLPRKHEMHQG